MLHGTRLYFATFAALMIVLVSAPFIQEQNTEQRTANVGQLLIAQSHQTHILLYLRLMADAEADQRGFLITQDPSYLEPYEASRKQAAAVLDRIVAAYEGDTFAPNDAIRTTVDTLQELHTAKMQELASSIALVARLDRDEAFNSVRTDHGKRTMDRIRAAAAELERYEEQHVSALLEDRRDLIFASHAMAIASTTFNMALLTLATFLLRRDLRQRENLAAQRDQHSRELEQVVQLRTQELSALSSHLQTVAEREKATIARELHDELGGLMAAAKMDVAWLERQIRPKNELKIRWNRLRKLLDDGVEMKRRVVETLRPTLLDNLGLVPAVKWIYAETCSRAGLNCRETYSHEDLRLSDEAGIAVFRIIQESLTNILKHARASEVFLSMNVEGDALTIVIRDNGVGIPLSQNALRGHGLASMRHRVTSFGGTLRIRTPSGGGTEIEISLPLRSILPADDAVADAASRETDA